MRKKADLKKLLGDVFDTAREGLRASLDAATYEERRREFVFHMTDWLSDLEELRHLLRRPDLADPDVASTQVIGFLYHVVPHLNAAGRLLLDEIGDPFAVPIRKGVNGAASPTPAARRRPRPRKRA